MINLLCVPSLTACMGNSFIIWGDFFKGENDLGGLWGGEKDRI